MKPAHDRPIALASAALLLLVLLLTALTETGLAQGPSKHQKIGSAVIEAIRSGQLQPEVASRSTEDQSKGLTPAGIQVYIEVIEVSEVTLAELEALGVTVELTDPAQRLVQARVPVTRLEAVADLPSVRFIRLPDFWHHNRQGSTGTEGDAVTRAHLLRRQLGVTGAGVRVGVISGGITGLTQSIVSGNLPPTTLTRDTGGALITTSGGVTASCCRVDHDLEANNAEGAAMLEIIHDIAPGAQLFFANASTSLEFNQAVNFLAAQTDIVVDDISFFNVGRYDGTSFVSQNTTNALNSPSNPIKAYFTSAGNYRQQHYRGAFSNSGTSFPSIEAIEGGPSNAHLFMATSATTGPAPQPFNEITVPPGGAMIFLQWNDPFGGSANDYDLFVLHSDGSIVTASIDLQTGTQNPREKVFIPNFSSTPLTLRYVIVNFQNRATPRTFDIFLISTSSVAVPTHQFNSPGMSIPNQSDAGGGVLSVGAIPWFLPDLPEPFSSQGPTLDGRLKPELAGPDCVSVSGAGGFSPLFCGTSAAAPHTAAVAALLLSQNPNFTRSQLADLLTGTTVDLGPPGPDNRFGFGRVDAFPTAPRAIIAVDRAAYRTGDTLHLSASLWPGSALNTGDAYVVAILPDDVTLFSIIPAIEGGFTGTLGLQPLALGFAVPWFSGEFFEYTFSGAEPAGLYQVLGVVTLPSQIPLPLDADHLEQTIIFDGTAFLFSP
jgi:subtilisin family serine protease